MNARKKINLKPHQKIVKIEKDGVIHLIPQKSIREMRGFLKGMDTSQLRDEQNRW